MRTLPIALPTCGGPATVRLEIYSAANGDLHGSLDASAYVCDLHGIPAVSACQAAGLTARRVPLAPDINRPCGHVHVYPTGQLSDPADMPHPHWCDRRDCAGRGQHRSVRLPVNAGCPDPTIVELTLTQALAAAVDPMLTLTVIDAGGQEVVLSLGQGRVLSHQVRRLLDLSKGCRGARRASW